MFEGPVIAGMIAVRIRLIGDAVLLKEIGDKRMKGFHIRIVFD